jgi:hypothetical protein
MYHLIGDYKEKLISEAMNCQLSVVYLNFFINFPQHLQTVFFIASCIIAFWYRIQAVSH